MKKNERYLESIASLISDNTSECNTIFLTSPTDIGVRRNGGRNGTRFAPNAIINSFKKMNHNNQIIAPIAILSVSSMEEEILDFHNAQDISSKAISTLNILNFGRVVHIGGGHDHAYPLLKALNEKSDIKNILIVNIDAHCDTRVDDKRHSGTPFRDFSKINTKDVTLIQYGLHSFANSLTTQSDIEKSIKQTQIFLKESSLLNLKEEISKHNLPKDTLVYISLDADALNASTMEAVSAVNHHGLQLQNVLEVIMYLKDNFSKSIFGIYEYNPIFDNQSQKGSRALCALIYEYLSNK